MTRSTRPPSEQIQRAPVGSSPFIEFGRRCWMFVGVVLAASIVFAALASLSGLVVPLIVAAVIGVLIVRLVDRVEGLGIPRRASVAIVMLAFTAVVVGAVWIAVAGIVDQGSEITSQVRAGVAALEELLDESEALQATPGLFDEISEFVPQAAAGLAGLVSNAFTGVVAFVIGTFVALFFLYYLLADWDRLVEWLAAHLGVARDLGIGILDDTMLAFREYFKGLGIASIIVATLIGLTMWILGLPLAFSVAVVTFVTSYIPYLGAVFSGAFAFLVALGSGDIGDALVVLVVILVAQNLVQTLVQNKLTSDQLEIHPIVNFGSTIIGIALAGVLGATISAPVVASLIRMAGRIRGYRADGDSSSIAASP